MDIESKVWVDEEFEALDLGDPSIADTIELDFNGQVMEGLGPLSFEAQRGMYLHRPTPSHRTGNRRGYWDAWMWAREPLDASGRRSGIKESTRWIESYERVAEQAATLPDTRLVYVTDREGDIAALPPCLGTGIDQRRDAPSRSRMHLKSRLLGDLELHLSMRLPLHDHRARQDRLALSNVADAQTDQVTAA